MCCVRFVFRFQENRVADESLCSPGISLIYLWQNAVTSLKGSWREDIELIKGQAREIRKLWKEHPNTRELRKFLLSGNQLNWWIRREKCR